MRRQAMADEPCRGVHGAVQFIELLPSRKRDNTVGQRQAQVLGGSRSVRKWNYGHLITVSVAI
ncbi:hypothetical protein StoSoilB5_24420 [Arthrobacter sp. StoSoilB5]|nr:hypothetical protein StoSoilB5_24420 [Arthrobacter sp. StoSoilB5]